ncbi:MAG: glycosyltransferase family 2 protein [Sedimentisphaerales bacterium]|jgi:GT2 family glycosyltransferase
MAQAVSIVILNYKNWQDTLECLASVFEITYRPYRVIVVDNDSQNGSLDEIEKWLAVRRIQPLRLTQQQSEMDNFDDNPLVLIQSTANRGYAAGNNIGIRWAIRAGSPYVMILNNDTIVQKDFLEPLAEFLDNNPDTAMVGPKILDLDGNIDRNCARRRSDFGDYMFRIGVWGKLFPGNYWHRRHYYIGEYDFSAPRQVDVIAGSCMLIRLSTFQKVGLFDENTFLFYEEFILSDQLRRIDMQTHIIPSSLIVHKSGQSIKKQPDPKIVKIIKEGFYYYLRRYRRYPYLFIWLIYLNQELANWKPLKKLRCRKFRSF